MPWDLTGNSGTDPQNNFLGTTDNQPLAIRTNGSERIRIASDGKLGIGTINPGANLTVNVPGSTSPISALSVDVQSFGTQPNTVASHYFRVRDIGSGLPSAFFIRGDGRVGIGTESPNENLTVAVRGRTTPIGAMSIDVGSFGTAPNAQASYYFRVRDAGNTAFLIRGDGRVGVGTNSPEAKLAVAGGIRASDLIINVPGRTTPIGAMSIDVGSFGTAPNARASYYFRVRDAGNTAFLIRGDGNVEVAGDISLQNADCAEDFDVARTEEIEPGTVVVLNEEGVVNRSTRAYDKRVAGVISGAGGYKSGITLDKQAARKDRIPVALMGKVYCKVEARSFRIGAGDLLTTSSTPGHAMKADVSRRASGAVLGKALRSLKEGQGMIPILVTLQ